MRSAAEEAPRFGQHLRRLREAAGLTQEELAARAGMSANSIAALERGRRQRPHPATVRALAEALGLSEEGRAALAARGAASGEAPAPAAGAPAARPEALHLPLPPPDLIGREQDLAALGALFGRGARLVTITGPGGVGKTSLGVRFARDAAARFPDGAAFVGLAPLTDAALVLPAIAQALAVREAAGQTPRDALHAHLAGRRTLLVLDNLEHLLEAAPAVAELLGAAGELRVLAVSRAPLRVRDEQEYPLPPLPLPDLSRVPAVEELAGNPAVALFVERARAVTPGFALTRANAAAVAAIVRRLDGLPLALELAAARLRSLSPTELLARLDRALPLLAGGARDLPERQRTMERAIDWSYDLVEPAEARLFRRLAVFAGGWDLAAAEAVGQRGDEAEGEVLALLSSLVEQSLVTAEGGGDGATRYRLLEPVREYAAQRLRESGEADEARRWHAAYYLALAEAAEPALWGAEQTGWLARLEAEHDNLRAALAWLLDRAADGGEERAERALRLAGALWRFWGVRGHLSEGRRWLEAVLGASAGRDLAARTKALDGAGWLAQGQGDLAQAVRWHEEGAALCRRLGDRAGLATALRSLGALLTALDDVPGAIPFLEESVVVARELADPRELGQSLTRLGAAVSLLGDHGRARALLEESLAVQRPLGDRLGIGGALFHLAVAALERRDYGQARAHLAEAFPLFREVGHHLGIAFGLEVLAAAALEGWVARAVRLWAAADALREAAGSRRVSRARRYEAQVAAMRAQLDEETRARAEAEGRAMTPEQAVADGIADDAEDATPSAVPAPPPPQPGPSPSR